MNEQKRDKYVLTEIYDLHKDLNFKITEDINVPIP